MGQNSFESDDQLVIALDFGTTFSGIAYSFKNDEKPEVIAILDWPGTIDPVFGSGRYRYNFLGREGYKQPKVPTAICYDPDDQKSFT